MVINLSNMKRKRRDECPSPLLDDSPKRTKVHAQRKFAQGSNPSPVITPVEEIEQEVNVIPEPVELLPIKRPNTEDFLTFLCFRGTPLLPPNLNFFNTASLVDTNGQVHGLKSDSPKNGPLDTSSISKSGSGSSERPFIAFGVRKRADPIVISRQMDKKRRHALALQALRRKYQEQKMAKIRAVTISKINEKAPHKSMLRSNSVTKNETVTKKNTVLKPKAIEVTRDEKITTRSVKAALRPQIKQKMCLRSFRGRFVQKELQFRNVKKRALSVKKIAKNSEKESENKGKESEGSYSSGDEEPLSKSDGKKSPKVVLPKVTKKSAPGPKKAAEINFRITRSNKLLNNKIASRRQQIKQRMLLSTPKTIIKPRTLRSQTAQKRLLPEVKQKLFVKNKKEIQAKEKKNLINKKPVKVVETPKNEIKENKKEESSVKKETKVVESQKKIVESQKKIVKPVESLKKAISPPPTSLKIEKTVKKEPENVKKMKVIQKQTQENKPEPKIETKKDVLTKKKATVVLRKNVTKPIEKKDVIKEKKANEEEKKIDLKVNSEERTSQRPTRKTKEAAAIYMEILSHKLVNESKIDDDNVSIDSFPELPNVKKTEQRENELKAKAKSHEIKITGENKVLRSSDKKVKKEENKKLKTEIKKEVLSEEEIVKKIEEESRRIARAEMKEDINERKTRSATHDKVIEKKKEVELKVHINSIDLEAAKPEIKEPAKKKCPEVNNESSDDKKKEKKIAKNNESDDKKIKKKIVDISFGFESDESFEIEKIEVESKRQTRNSSQNIRHIESDDSDESFRADIRIPRKKQITRSKVKNDDDHHEKARSSSESDQSTTSDVNLQITANKNKKFTKTRKKDESFSDSDEEPLSKLTNKAAKEEAKEEEREIKPKRECAKRPQNYLPMFSSSDEDENYFQGFKIQKDKKSVKEEPCVHLPNSDLSCKDIGRRFGKGKVNMSTEQIEKWLKDSAMAGNSVKNENDAMLKFGEKIPTETSLTPANFIDTEKLKILLIPSKIENKKESPKTETNKIKIPKCLTQNDRKLIFRNKDKGTGVNINAFSANNENSVYAFEEPEDLKKTPFRRPSRRPSSTATSKSEDERFEDASLFRRPLSTSKSEVEEKDDAFPQPNKFILCQKIEKKVMTPPNSQKVIIKQMKVGRDDDFKYKVPSSPSASSSSSAKLSKRQCAKFRVSEVLPVKLPDFPTSGAQLVEALTFHPSEKEFQDPIEYIEKIRAKAEQFGICRIIPPSTFKPECKVTDDMRFTAYNQYVHKMLHRWGPNFKELMAIKKYLSTQNISLTHPPWIGGMEIDLPRLYQTVQSLGGLKEVIEKKKWPKVSDLMKIPKSAQDRVTKLDDIYCKYLLPYDTLSPAEREKLFDEVETDWAKRESKSLLKAQQDFDENKTDENDESESDDEAEECIVKGRNMALNAFYRIARNTMSMWFKNPEPPPEEVEQEFWKHVTLKQNHICVHSGSIDSGNWGYGFAVSKNSPFARHAWNLKVLTNNSGSVLRSMGPVMGVTVPTLHVGMVFSSCCWYRDPHSLPWIEYLHTGGNKIWYGIPNSTSAAFQAALKTLVPNYCRNKSLWLPSDTVMVPPNLLVENGVSLSRIVQEPGQFIVVFPKVFTSSLSTGYVVSESVYFAPPWWLKAGRTVFEELRNSCEPAMFSFDRLLLNIINDARSNVEVLKQIIPSVQELCDNEKAARERVKSLGITATEKLPVPETPQIRKKRKMQNEDGEYECEICRMTLFISMVTESQEDAVFCLDHASEQIEKKKILSKQCKLTYTYDDEELDNLVEKIKTAIVNKLQKKVPNKFAGLPTLLK